MLEKITADTNDGDCIALDDVYVYHPEKAVFPKDGIKKIDLAEYYESVAHLMLSHIKDRPLTMERYPNGFGKQGGLTNGVVDSLPDYVLSVSTRLPDKKTETQSLLCQNTRTLIYLTDSDHLTYYGWLSRFDKPQQPDKMVIDLDPPDVTYFEETIEAAFLLKGLLEEANMYPFVMTTGSRGLHVVCPLRRNRGFEQVQAFLTDITQKAVARRPELVTVQESAKGEHIKLGIDRNVPGGVTVIPYSVRAMDHAPVATPLAWSELESRDMHPQRFTVKNIAARLERKGDVWENFFRHKRKLMK